MKQVVNENFPQYNNVDLALDALFNKVYYVKPSCSLSADKKGGTFEMGTVISAPITFTWTTNKNITSQTLTGCTLADANVRTATYNTNVTSDKSFTLSVSDGENFASSSVSYKFLNKVYYGSASEPNSYDSAFILGLANNKFATTIKGSYPITVESGQFGYIACPKSFNAPSECYIGGFLTTLENAGEISFTNASGGYISKLSFGNYGYIPVISNGSATTYCCDGLWFNNSQIGYALVGGGSADGYRVGAFYSNLYLAVSDAVWYSAAALSCKPLATT